MQAPGPQHIEDIEVSHARAEDGTIKFLTGLEDGHEVESVILPLRGSTGRIRRTLCVSSQVGCAMGCTFCETAQMGLVRSLDASEILLQWSVARYRFNSVIDNIVFMGMGEPLDNVEAVIESIQGLVDQQGPSIASSRISVSTVGRIDGIRKLSRFISESSFGRIRLAVSINAPNDEIRSSIMPLNRAMPMNDLHDALVDWTTTHRWPILLEYVLIPGVNDRVEHADQLAGWVDGLPCRINLIPYNPRRNSPWDPPTDNAVEAFGSALAAHGLPVNRRITMGRSLMAACGQLGNEEIRKRKRIPVRVGD